MPEPTIQNIKDRGLHEAFLATVLIKGFDGVLEIVLGFLLMFTTVVNSVILFLIRDELIEYPYNFFATHLRALATQSHHAQLFGGLYLVAHGIVKTFLSVALWKNYAWAYPAAMAFLGLFIMYQLIRIAQTLSVPLMLLTLFDIVMLLLVAREYRSASHKA